MRNPLVVALIALLCSTVPTTAADYYKLPNIQRIERDLYLSSMIVIETRSCFHRTAGEAALLEYEGPGEYEILWEDHSTCDVQKVVALEESRSAAQVDLELQTRPPAISKSRYSDTCRMFRSDHLSRTRRGLDLLALAQDVL